MKTILDALDLALEESKLQAKKEMALEMYKQKIDLATISKCSNFSIPVLKEWINDSKKY